MIVLHLKFAKGPSGLVSLSGLTPLQAHEPKVLGELGKIREITPVISNENTISFKPSADFSYEEPVINAVKKALPGVHIDTED